MNKKGDVDKDLVVQAGLVLGLIFLILIIFAAWNAGGMKKALGLILGVVG